MYVYLLYCVCIVVVVLCVLLSFYVYLLYYVCIAVFPLDAGLLARKPAVRHLKEKQQYTHSTTNTHKMTTIHTRHLKIQHVQKVNSIRKVL